MVKNIKLSGVVLTRDLNNYNPYLVVNYSTGSDSTLVTSGKNKKPIRGLLSRTTATWFTK